MANLKLCTRPPLTDYEATIVRDFQKALKTSETFYMTGNADVGNGNPMIMYTAEGVDTK